jgi:hypothetical protein
MARLAFEALSDADTADIVVHQAGGQRGKGGLAEIEEGQGGLTALVQALLKDEVRRTTTSALPLCPSFLTPPPSSLFPLIT